MHLFIILFSLALSGLAFSKPWKGVINDDIPKLKERAEAGDPEAMADYAFHSMRCMGGTRYDSALIFDYFNRSAKAGNQDGQVGLAHCYRFGIGTNFDGRKALKLIQDPLKENHPVALSLDAVLYRGFYHIRKYNQEIFNAQTEKSAAAGYVAAIYNSHYYKTILKDKSQMPEGMKGLRELHEQKLFPLATVYLWKNRHLFPEIWDDHVALKKQCLKELLRNSALNEPFSQIEVAENYYFNLRDHDAGISLMLKAADGGSQQALERIYRMMTHDWNFISASADSRRLFMTRAYMKGTRNSISIREAALTVSRHPNRYRRIIPDLYKDLKYFLDVSDPIIYRAMGALQVSVDAKKHPTAAKPELGIAHLVYCSDKDIESVAFLANYFSKQKNNDSLAKAFACSLVLKKEKDEVLYDEARWKKFGEDLNDQARAKADALAKENYPTGQKFREEAKKKLLKAKMIRKNTPPLVETKRR